MNPSTRPLTSTRSRAKVWAAYSAYMGASVGVTSTTDTTVGGGAADGLSAFSPSPQPAVTRAKDSAKNDQHRENRIVVASSLMPRSPGAIRECQPSDAEGRSAL